MCIPTSGDPNNCGKCGVTCTGNEVCAGNACSTSCRAPLSICLNDHTCDDLQNDNNHCGDCMTKCPPGQGCVAGACEKSVALGPAPAKCAGGGPPIVNPAGQGGCLGGLAATTFRWTLCSCKDVKLSDTILVDAYDSTMGPYVPGTSGGGVGANRNYQSSSNSTPPSGGIYGDLWASGTAGVSDSADELIKHVMKSGGGIQSSATMTIGGDAYAEGVVSGGVKIGGKLYVPDMADAKVTPAGGVSVGPVSFNPPCDCNASQLVPIAAMVSAHAGTNNDNAAIGLDANVLAGPNAPTRLDLPCGSYYLSSIKPSVPVTIWAHGQTALYIGTDVNSSDDIAFGVDPTGAFDVFIGGRLSTSSKLTIGSPNWPALTRTYVGSTSGVGLSSDAYLSGELYAGYGPVDWSAGTDAYGAVFAGDFGASAATRIHYDLGVLQVGNACPPTGGGGSGGGSDGGGGSGGCGTCNDCMNQACINGQCGSCTTDAQCCSPLVCQGGTCVAAVIK
jgi:hypothetical protein